MGIHICKLDDMFFAWSTVVDAPVSGGLSFDNFVEWYRDRPDAESMVTFFSQIMPLVMLYGTTEHGAECVEDTCWNNRAGLNDTWLNRAQLVQFLQALALDPGAQPPLGIRHDYSIDEDTGTSFGAFMGLA